MVRVRFAPSPTGYLHIGNARAAVLNWLFAHHMKGEFMLRLDDTDLERSKEEYERAIHEDLAWLGITHDLYARQSDRFDRYREAMQSLIDQGRLYPCYETPEELEFKRKRQLAKGEPPIYDRTSLKLSEEEKKKYEDEGRKPHWRFKLLPGSIAWNDLIRGPIEFQGERLSDPVLVRADGAFLYTLTSVVDDLDFNITHIIRGEDHVTNTSVQIQLFEALNGDKSCDIQFAHFTLLLDRQGHGLSKRLGSLSLQDMKKKGLEPMAINSLLARLGTSLPVEPVLTLNELIPSFSLNIFSKNPPHFDEHELEILNHKLMQIMPYEHIQDRLPNEITKPIWDVIKKNINYVYEAQEWQHILSDDLPITPHTEHDYLKKALELLPDSTWSDETWQMWTTALKQETGRKGKDLFMPLRQALTNQDHGPEMKVLLPFIGFERAKARLLKAIG